MNRLQKFLFIAGLGTIPIALSYGLFPQKSLSLLYNIPAASISEFQVFRSIMGLYLGFCGLWIIAAFNKQLARPASYILIIFMLGLASGRMIGLLFDGMPNWVLFGYMCGEIFMAVIAIILLIKSTGRE